MELDKLVDFRKKGSITVHAKYDTFKKIRNTFKNDVPWKGPNQAYLLSILNLTSSFNKLFAIRIISKSRYGDFSPIFSKLI